jgi:hypothetical protein
MLVVSALLKEASGLGGSRDKATAQRRRACLAVLRRRAVVEADFFNGGRSGVDMATQLIRWTGDKLTQGQVARGCLSRFTRVGAVGIKL